MRIKNPSPAGWYDIPGYDGQYQINIYGEIRRVCKSGKVKHLHPYPKKTNGQIHVKLKRKEIKVITLMTSTFFGKPAPGYVAYHNNGMKSDNSLGNIKIITKEEAGRLTGKLAERAMKILKINEEGEIVACYPSAREAARKNYMSYQTVLDYVNGRRKNIFAADGHAYIKDDDRCLGALIRRIEQYRNAEIGGIYLTKAPQVEFDF